jgi:hypothetical protein
MAIEVRVEKQSNIEAVTRPMKAAPYVASRLITPQERNESAGGTGTRNPLQRQSLLLKFESEGKSRDGLIIPASVNSPACHRHVCMIDGNLRKARRKIVSASTRTSRI